MRGLFKLMVAFLLLPILAACSGGTSTNQSSGSCPSSRANLHFAVVVHGQSSNSFWAVLYNGAQQAAKDMCVHVTIQAPDTFDMVKMANLIDAAVATKPDGLVVSIPDPAALGPSIKRAMAAGIPVISVNSGSDVAQALGVLVHVGQTEYEAGLGGGQKMGAAGAKHTLCVNHEVGNAALDTRCKGFSNGMAKTGGTVKVLGVNPADPNAVKQRIEASLTADPSIDSIITLEPLVATSALQALTDLNKVGQIKLATFDLSTDVLQAIQSGKMVFAIDQQQYLQGYLPIVLLTLYRTNLNTIANPVLLTGPGFVTKDNASKIITLTQQGSR
jgi:simple sugar transport system substrate-binding protein